MRGNSSSRPPTSAISRSASSKLTSPPYSNAGRRMARNQAVAIHARHEVLGSIDGLG